MDARFIDVSWSDNPSKEYLARILIRTKNIGNNILDIVTKASQRNLYIDSINTHEHGEKLDYEILVKVPNSSMLKLFMIDCEALEFVDSVERELK